MRTYGKGDQRFWITELGDLALTLHVPVTGMGWRLAIASTPGPAELRATLELEDDGLREIVALIEAGLHARRAPLQTPEAETAA